jgi:class 3 adenylate cyclase
MEPPDTRYVRVGDADVAYQVIGEGPLDLLYCQGVGHIDQMWELPPQAELLLRLSSFSRLIVFDRRGTGASDPVRQDAPPTWEEWTEDLRAVLDAVGSQRAAVFAQADAGPIAVMFAAMQPQRVGALILADTSARFMIDDDYPFGRTQQDVDLFVDLIGKMWGTPELTQVAFPRYTDNPEWVRFFTRFMRTVATPRAVAAQYRYIYENLDVRDALPVIQAPTLVLHHVDSPFVPIEHGRYLAEHIAGTRLVELPGNDTLLTTGDADVWVTEVEEFLTGRRTTAEIDRILVTLLFTDIVKSTEVAASLGDHRWRSLLDAHDRTVREELSRFRGTEIKTMGDGFMASFDGPARAIRCARAIVKAVGGLEIELRAGLHTGECEVRGDDLGGLAVHIAARVGALAGASEVLVSGTVKDLVVGSDIEFEDRGQEALKGVPGIWKLFAVKD